MRILITGGAGFIGSHLADRLVADGHDVVAFDSLDHQVHATGERPSYLSTDVKLVVGDVRDRDAVADVIADADAIYHLAPLSASGSRCTRLSSTHRSTRWLQPAYCRR